MIAKDLLHNYSEQIEAIQTISPILKMLQYHIPRQEFRFGGGTALAIYYFQHRLSFDLDFFVGDCQYLDYIRPKLWIDDYPNFSSEYIDQAHHIGVSTKNTKIDFLYCSFYGEPIFDESREIFACDFYIESIEDIVAKKITFRKKENKTRDIIDIAIALHHSPCLFEKLLDLGAIELQDLEVLLEKISTLNLEKYHQQVQIIQPTQKYKQIINEAPKFLCQSLNAFLK